MSESHTKSTWLSWLEIPSTNFNRAQQFYETIFDIQLTVQDLGVIKMGIFPHAQDGLALVKSEWYKPSTDGPLIYLNANPDLNKVANKIEAAGGKIIQSKKMISPEHGFMCLFLDSEGNRIALHSDQ